MNQESKKQREQDATGLHLTSDSPRTPPAHPLPPPSLPMEGDRDGVYKPLLRLGDRRIGDIVYLVLEN